MYIPNINNDIVLNTVNYISSLFKKHRLLLDHQFATRKEFMFVVFRKYAPKKMTQNDLEKLYAINDEYYKIDSTGGYENKFINHDLDLVKSEDIANLAIFKNKYISDLANSYEDKVELLYVYKDIYQNLDNKLYIDGIMKKNINFALLYAQTHNLELKEWFNKNPENYFNFMLNEEIKDKPLSYYSLLNSKSNIKTPFQNNSLYTNLKINSDLKKSFELLNSTSEQIYKYIVNTNNDLYKNIELFINHNYKLLNKKLLSDYKININGQYVSRAWNKMREILVDTDFFDNLTRNQTKTITGFHTCEAPGAFVNSIVYWLQNMNVRYEWTAQSLFENGLGDSYKFIAKTSKNWDYGPKKTGDITDIANFKYYLTKYSGRDIYIRLWRNI